MHHLNGPEAPVVTILQIPNAYLGLSVGQMNLPGASPLTVFISLSVSLRTSATTHHHHHYLLLLLTRLSSRPLHVCTNP